MTGAFLHPFASPARERFVSIERGEGAVVWDTDGKEYLDAMASLWYCSIGHGRQEMADAVAEQMTKLAAYSCFDPFGNPWADALAGPGRRPVAHSRCARVPLPVGIGVGPTPR